MALLAQHRIVTTHQLHTMLHPGGSRSLTARTLGRLRENDLASSFTVPSTNRAKGWFLTSRGARVTESWPELRGRSAPVPSTGFEASLKSAHTLTVVRAHMAFLVDARRRGDEYEPLDWVPEVSHRLPDTGGEDRLIADAVLHYTAATEQRLQYRAFVEVDRATMSSERLARKLISYARFHDYSPKPLGRRGTVAEQASLLAWQRFYPRFPRTLFILTGASTQSLNRRIGDLRAMVSGHSLVKQFAARVPLGAALLDDLEAHGASAPVWTPLNGPAERRSWMEL
jgi:hypothetical protein